MQKTELDNYFCQKVLIGLNDGRKLKGFLIRLNENEVLLQNPMYDKAIVLAIKDIISIKLLIGFWERQRRYFFHS